MRVFDLWKNTFAIKVTMLIVCLMIFSFGNTTLYAVVGMLILLGSCAFAVREGAQAGHRACGISAELAVIAEDRAKLEALDDKMKKGGFSVHRGLAAVLAGGLIDYVINCVYIVVMLSGGISTGVLAVTRLLAFGVSVPYWSFLALWHETFTMLSWDIVLVLMLGPFLIPACQFIGYMQGPKLWKKTEEAMTAGRRRAKARSRIGRDLQKRAPKQRKPEI